MRKNSNKRPGSKAKTARLLKLLIEVGSHCNHKQTAREFDSTAHLFGLLSHLPKRTKRENKLECDSAELNEAGVKAPSGCLHTRVVQVGTIEHRFIGIVLYVLTKRPGPSWRSGLSTATSELRCGALVVRTQSVPRLHTEVTRCLEALSKEPFCSIIFPWHVAQMIAMILRRCKFCRFWMM